MWRVPSLKGLDEILTLVKLGLPAELRRSLASTNIIESMNSVVRQTCRNVKAVARRQNGPAMDRSRDA